MYIFDNSSLISLRMIHVSNKSRRENQNITFSNFSENHAAYEKIWKKKIVEPRSPQMKIRRILFANWIPKAKKSHSEYVILIAFLRA
jgi:hypothetical protein